MQLFKQSEPKPDPVTIRNGLLPNCVMSNHLVSWWPRTGLRASLLLFTAATAGMCRNNSVYTTVSLLEMLPPVTVIPKIGQQVHLYYGKSLSFMYSN